MRAVFASRVNRDDPLSGLEIGERPEPEAPDGWTLVAVRAASLNHHDLWSLRGVGLPEDRLPMILGCDAAGLDEDGNEVVVHAVISSPDWRGDETLDPKRSLLSERYQGALAERVAVPRRNVLPKPPELSFEEAACLPTAWLTAYRMLFTRGGVTPGSTLLVQGAGGGVATAAIVLASAAGARVWVTARSEEKRDQARGLGADATFEAGARLPERVDVVIETVGEATWGHSVRSLKPGGTLVVSGATTGDRPPAELSRVFFLQLSVVGSTMGTRDELERLIRLCIERDVRPVIDRTLPLTQAREGFEAMLDGSFIGKVVFTVDPGGVHARPRGGPHAARRPAAHAPPACDWGRPPARAAAQVAQAPGLPWVRAQTARRPAMTGGLLSPPDANWSPISITHRPSVKRTLATCKGTVQPAAPWMPGTVKRVAPPLTNSCSSAACSRAAAEDEPSSIAQETP
jgi:NADPH:quinone reductase-like Zn-dependent oxidoreductase